MSAGDRLLVSCLDSQHHVLPLLGCWAPTSASQPAAVPALASWAAPGSLFRGTFYARSALSPCGEFALCASSHGAAYVW